MNEGFDFNFDSARDLVSRTYTCGYCGEDISSHRGFTGWHKRGVTNLKESIYLCHHCGNPTFFDLNHEQHPGPLFPKVSGIPDELVVDMYDEARKAMSATAYSVTIMCCRTLLAHIAVSEGAGKGLKFVQYVDWLDSNRYIPKKGKVWVEEIKNKGNSAIHDIVIYKKEDAQKIMKFTEFLLKSIYEYPSYAV